METITVEVNGEEVHIQPYLPFEDKTNIIELAYQEAIDSSGFCNSIKCTVLRHMYMIFYYTDMKFTPEEKAEPLKLFDKMRMDGSFETIMKAIPKKEIDFIESYEYTYVREKDAFNTSFGGIISRFVEQIPSIVTQINNDLIPTLQKQVEELKN